jgi:TPR repeat protein
MELYTRAAELGSGKAHDHSGAHYEGEGDLKKVKVHYEAAAMAGHEGARYNLGCMECNSGNKERAIKHVMIAAAAGCYPAMNRMNTFFEKGAVGRELIDSTLKAYNIS